MLASLLHLAVGCAAVLSERIRNQAAHDRRHAVAKKVVPAKGRESEPDHLAARGAGMGMHSRKHAHGRGERAQLRVHGVDANTRRRREQRAAKEQNRPERHHHRAELD